MPLSRPMSDPSRIPLPRSPSLQVSEPADTNDLPETKEITLWQGICLIVTREIGAGIFSTPSIVNGNSGSVGMSLIIWFISGCLSYAGACKPCFCFVLTSVSYAELGSALPLNGGAYVYLHRVYGPVVACLFSWTTVFILKPAPVAIVSLVFGDYINRIVFAWLEPGKLLAQLTQKGAGLLCVWTIICVQAICPHWITTSNTVFTVIKLAAVGSIAAIGIWILGFPRLLLYLLKLQLPEKERQLLPRIGFKRFRRTLGISPWLYSPVYGLTTVQYYSGKLTVGWDNVLTCCRLV